MASRRFFTTDGPRIRELREQAGIDQPTLAAKVGISQSMMSRVEKGNSNPNPATTLRIAEALGVRFDDITERISA